LEDRFKLDPATGTISGTPTNAKTYTFSVTATNHVGSDEKEFTLIVYIPDDGCGVNTGVGSAAMFFVSLGAILAPRLRRKK
jgi:hypothetical protein